MANYSDFLTPGNCVLTLIDFQPAMFFGVQSHERKLVVHNMAILAKAAKIFNIPTVLSTVAKDSFSGPLAKEITDVFPDQPIIDRTSINAWLNADYRKAIEASKRKKIVIAGLWTEACVLFPSLELLKIGYEVYFVSDACGDVSVEAHERSVQRLIQAGAVPITALQFVFELQQDWAHQETYQPVMDLLKADSQYGIQVGFSKWALGEHASEGGSLGKSS
jgi:nicotinamidase-related amidase